MECMNTTEATQSPATATHALPSVLSTALATLQARRAERAARNQLERELSAYTSQSDRDDLTAMLDRYDDDKVADVRRILDQVRAGLPRL
jgi:hypothetical protein